MENENALKHMFGKDLLARISSAIALIHPGFNRAQFHALYTSLEPLEMKARVRLLRDELSKLLPANFPDSLEILMGSVEKGKLKDFDFWVYTEFIQTFGLEHPEESLNALRKLTMLFTSEWAVRPFLRQDAKKTLAYLLDCAKHEDERIRRWASEGSRPRLPWGERLHEFIINPELTLPILEQLKFDSAIFVRTSIANHLNDIAKDHPDYVIEILKRWQLEANKEQSVYLKWIIKRALRTLIKNGNPKALQLIGANADTKIEVFNFGLGKKQISMGDRLTFFFQIKSTSKTSQKLVLDYILHLVKSNGGTAPKVFKFKLIDLAGGQMITLQKAHHIKPVTTRKYYNGVNALEIQINGKSFGKMSWILK